MGHHKCLRTSLKYCPKENVETLVLLLPCRDSAQMMSRLKRDSGGTWSTSCIFWGRTIGELLRSSNEEGAECHSEFNTKVCKVL